MDELQLQNTNAELELGNDSQDLVEELEKRIEHIGFCVIDGVETTCPERIGWLN